MHVDLIAEKHSNEASALQKVLLVPRGFHDTGTQASLCGLCLHSALPLLPSYEPPATVGLHRLKLQFPGILDGLVCANFLALIPLEVPVVSDAATVPKHSEDKFS